MSRKKPDDFVTSNEAAAVLGYKSATLRTMRLRGLSLPYYKQGNGAVLYSRAEILAWKKKRERIERIAR